MGRSVNASIHILGIGWIGKKKYQMKNFGIGITLGVLVL